MKIGIVRHFKVQYKKQKYMNAEEFIQYITAYDTAGIIKNKVDINTKDWDKCYCSDMPRAIQTAQAIYKGKIIKSKLLREIDMKPWKMLKVRISAQIWGLMARLAWYMGDKSQSESRRETRRRITTFLDALEPEENVLIVSHGFFLITFVQELKRRGFRGEVPTKIENGKLYILEK